MLAEHGEALIYIAADATPGKPLAAYLDIILAAAPPGEGAAWVADWQRFPSLAAVRNHRVVAFENQALSRLGPSVLDATEELCRTIARVSRGSS